MAKAPMVNCMEGVRVHPEVKNIDQINQRIWIDDPSADSNAACEKCASVLAKTHGLLDNWACKKIQNQTHIQGCAFLQKCALPSAPSPPVPAPPPGACRGICTDAKKCSGDDPGIISAYCNQYNSKLQCDTPAAQGKRTNGDPYCKWYADGGGVEPTPTSGIVQGLPCTQLKRAKC